MTPNEIRKEISKTDKELRKLVRQIGVSKAVEITGLKQPDISAWLNRKREWSIEKTLRVANILFS